MTRIYGCFGKLARHTDRARSSTRDWRALLIYDLIAQYFRALSGALFFARIQISGMVIGGSCSADSISFNSSMYSDQ